MRRAFSLGEFASDGLKGTATPIGVGERALSIGGGMGLIPPVRADPHRDGPVSEPIGNFNCTLCSKSGALCAHLSPQISAEGVTPRHSRKDKAAPEGYFCETCWVRTHFTLTARAVARFGNVRMGVDMRRADGKNLAGSQLRYPDKRASPGKASSPTGARHTSSGRRKRRDDRRLDGVQS